LTALDRHRRDWEDLAEIDPLWAILASPETRGGRWNVDAFFASGEAEIAEVLRIAETLGYPGQHERALEQLVAAESVYRGARAGPVLGKPLIQIADVDV